MSHRLLLFSEFPEIRPHCVTIFVDVDVSLYSVSKHLGSRRVTRNYHQFVGEKML